MADEGVQSWKARFSRLIPTARGSPSLEQGSNMAVQAPAKTGFEKWQDGINKAVGDAKWNVYDCEIQRAVIEFNRHLIGTAGFGSLDWQLIKALLWTETGAENAEWKVRPMQI